MYNQKIVRDLFEKWGYEEIKGDPGETSSRWAIPHINHMILDRWLPREGCALDAGCGLGVEAVRMARRGLTVTAIDISMSLLRHAQRRAEIAGLKDRISFLRADITEPLPLPEGRFFACIAMTGVISHTGERHKNALSNLVTLVKPGGRIILGAQSYYGKIRQCLTEGRLDDAEHLAETCLTHTVDTTFEDYCFKPQELMDLLRELNCSPLVMLSAPTVGASGYASEELLRRALALERRFLGTPELSGGGEELIGVFQKSDRD